jgi:hypothetical protein
VFRACKARTAVDEFFDGDLHRSYIK